MKAIATVAAATAHCRVIENGRMEKEPFQCRRRRAANEETKLNLPISPGRLLCLALITRFQSAGH